MHVQILRLLATIYTNTHRRGVKSKGDKIVMNYAVGWVTGQNCEPKNRQHKPHKA